MIQIGVIARTAGYNLIEINASDERTAKVLKQRVKDVVQGNCINDNKPNLLLVDEIDGADASFVSVLVSMHEKKTPIVCVCNDLYAQVLRPLRAIAECVAVPLQPIHSLVARLHEICRLENVKTDTFALMTLAELTDGDIRSCLNTLQFLSRQGHINADLVKSCNACKDMQHSLFSIWNKIFSIQLSLDSLIHFIDSRSDDYDKIIDGCWENYILYKGSSVSQASFASNSGKSRFN